GLAQLPALANLGAFATMWNELGRYFSNPKLQQLFARYATYCGASPFSAPATLMLIAHAEQSGVWTIAGGMIKLADVLMDLAKARGAVFHFNSPVQEIKVKSGCISGVLLRDGRFIAADAVLANTDLAALDAGYLGEPAQQAVSGFCKNAKRSLSAITWALTGANAGMELAHHNVFFSSDYKAEFDTIAAGQIPFDPTVYVCTPNPGEYFCLINAPANGDKHHPNAAEEDQWLKRMTEKLQRRGLTLHPSAITRTGPPQFNQMFPGSGGALYGRALSSWRDSFNRPGVKTKLPGLYLAGGSVHPGPGLPMAALSGRLAATQILQDLASTKPLLQVAMPGGISTPLATTAAKPLH
ncbi:MAG TPA: FAD-dependent oxidoreductase, partial [Acidocella sp.]|nr:FAD-dependent oxidoreductase [Acidocella sp.]